MLRWALHPRSNDNTKCRWSVEDSAHRLYGACSQPRSSDNPVESFPGDEIVTVENALVNLDTDSDHLGDYRGERPCDFRIELDRKGGISLTIYSFYNNANMFTYPHDAFVMKKDSES